MSSNSHCARKEKNSRPYYNGQTYRQWSMPPIVNPSSNCSLENMGSQLLKKESYTSRVDLPELKHLKKGISFFTTSRLKLQNTPTASLQSTMSVPIWHQTIWWYIVHLYLYFLCRRFFRVLSRTIIMFQVFLSNKNNYMISSKYFYLMIMICLYTFIWFQVTNNNP